MPYELKIDGMAEISELLEKMEQQAPAVASGALFEGAGIMAKEILSEMAKVKTAPFKYATGGEKRLPSPEEKEVLEQAGVGIAKFDKNGVEIDTSVGFNVSGYATVNFKHMSSQARTNYKAASKNGGSNPTASSVLRALGKGKGANNMKPIGVIANSINSGTSFMQKQPFVRKAAKSGGPKAIAAMKDKIEKAFEAMSKK